MILLDLTLPRTLDALVARFADGSHRGARIEAWLFDNHAATSAAGIHPSSSILDRRNMSLQRFWPEK